MIAITVEFDIKMEHIRTFRQLVLAHAANCLAKEPPCRQFDVSFDPEHDHRVFLYELYDNEAAVIAHRTTAHFAVFSADTVMLINERRIRQLELASAWPPVKTGP